MRSLENEIMLLLNKLQMNCALMPYSAICLYWDYFFSGPVCGYGVLQYTVGSSDAPDVELFTVKTSSAGDAKESAYGNEGWRPEPSDTDPVYELAIADNEGLIEAEIKDLEFDLTNVGSYEVILEVLTPEGDVAYIDFEASVLVMEFAVFI
jgi:hypothetical protein